MKKLIIILLFIVVLFALTGCESTYYSANETDRFVEIKQWTDEHGYTNYIVYDKETLVEYWEIVSHYKYEITVLLDADGKPILYKEE